jgi:DNA uptake protein ComE-like DNA-binding protein
LLWALAILAVVVIGVLHTATLDLRVGKNYADEIQAHYLALAGIEKAKALLYHEATERRGSRVHHSGKLYDAPEHFRDVALGRGGFRVIRQGSRREGGGLVHGIDDEESRLNINHAPAEELDKLPGVTKEETAAIIDYRDGDNSVTQGGAEEDQYAMLQPPYLPRNAPFPTLREVLMVLGVSREYFLGYDSNLNGLLDPGEGNDNPAALDAGWSEWVTVESAVRNVNAAGEGRVNLQEADESTLTSVSGISTEIAQAIIRHRGENRFESVIDLLEVRAPGQQQQQQQPQLQQQSQPQPQSGPQGSNVPPSRTGPRSQSTQAPPSDQPQPASSGQSGPTGPPLVSEDLLIDIADELTVQSESELPGLVNVNTAAEEVILCLPGVERELAHAIVSHRASNGYFPNVASLLRVPGMTRDILGQLAPRVTTRSETFRILSEGRITSTGARKRIQVTVRLGGYYVDTLAYREDDL